VTASTSRRQELVAEFAVLSLHDQIRRQHGYDYGAGQRRSELRNRRWFLQSRGAGELIAVPLSELLAALEPAELLAAFERVALPRMRRAGRYRSSSWYSVLHRLATVYDVGPLLLPDRDELAEQNGHYVHVEVELELYTDRRGV
jgi:hypothetical protein